MENYEIAVHFLRCLEEGKDTAFDMSVTVFARVLCVSLKEISINLSRCYAVKLKQSLKHNSSTRG